jgi:hypothetical protein
MSVLAVIRPDDWNFPLLLHVLGAMLLVSALVLSASVLLFSARDNSAALSRLGLRSLIFGVFPAWLLMRGAAASIQDKEGLKDAKVTWLDIGFTTADIGLPLILISMLLAWLAVRRARRDDAPGPGALGTAAAVISSLLLIAYVVTMWAMTTKPT